MSREDTVARVRREQHLGPKGDSALLPRGVISRATARPAQGTRPDPPVWPRLRRSTMRIGQRWADAPSARDPLVALLSVARYAMPFSAKRSFSALHARERVAVKSSQFSPQRSLREISRSSATIAIH